MGFFCRIVLAAMLVATVSAKAAPFEVEVIVPKEPVYLGEVFAIYVIVEGLDSVASKARVQYPGTDNVVVRAVGNNASESGGIIKHSFTFECLSRKAGAVDLGVLNAQMGDEALVVEVPEIEVLMPKETDAMTLSVSLSSKECYVGEAIVMSFDWHSEIFLNGIRALDVRLPLMNDPRFKAHQPLVKVDPNDASAIGIPVENRRIIAELSEERKGDTPIGDIRFELVVVPRESGTLEIPGSVLLCSYVRPKDQKFSGFRYPSYFNNDFFDKSVKGAHERFLVRSKPIRLEVKPLPQQGRPTEFSGIVGKVGLSVDATPIVAAVSDPIGLKLRLSGHRYPHTLPAPDLEKQSALGISFDFADEAGGMYVEDGNAVLARTIRPLRANVKEIPPILLNYFDPEAGTYGQVESPSIAVTVSNAARVDAFDAVFSDGSKLKNEVVRSPVGISHNHNGAELLQRAQPVSWPGNVGWFWILLLGGPAALFMILAFFSKGVRLALRDPDAARAKRAYAVFSKKVSALRKGQDLEPQEVTDALAKAVNIYVADRFGLCRGAASDQEMARLLGRWRVDENLVRQLELFWDQTASLQFSNRSPNGTGTGDAVREIPAAIGEIERGLCG